jgi:diguanylate cyclase (GGDEF)-like protein
MPAGQDEPQHIRLAHAMTVNPLRSLPARISFIVLGATLITSLAITAISVRSIDDFLRVRIEETFPTILDSTVKRLNLWYDQRLLEMEVFASSGIMTENAPLLAEGLDTRRARRAREEVEQYLSYVLDSFPQYDALLVLGRGSKRLISVGAEFELPDSALDHAVPGLTTPRLSAAIPVASGTVQLVSAPLAGKGTNSAGTLHAVMRMEAIAELLAGEEVGELGEVFLLDESRAYLAASPERMASRVWSAPNVSAGSGATFIDHYDNAGERVVGSTHPMGRFGWILAVEVPYSHAFAPVISGMRRILTINLAIVLLFAFGAFRAARSIVKPIEALSRIARRISEGESGIEMPDSDRRDEVGILTRTFKKMTGRLEASAGQMRDQNTELQRMNEILAQLSITDGLTKLHNHRYFQEHLASEVKRAARSNEPLSLILIDIDHFKMWNDRLGHSGGDEILRRIAEIMQQLTRGTDLLARYGGEEFALLLPSTGLDGSVQLAEKIRSAIAETEFFIDPPSERESVTVSIGVSAFHGDRRAFFDDADQALYRAKHAGRDCVMVAGVDEGEVCS